MRVAFVGLGTMGKGMVRNLASAGFPLALASRTVAAADALAREMTDAGREAAAFETAADAARGVDVVVSCVPDAPEVEEVYLGPHGVGSTAARGTIAVDCSTIAPDAARRVARGLAERGVAFLDAPVSGGQKGANEGTLTFFVGGEPDALDRARPVLAAMGRRITHLGPSGAGQLGKATNQILVAGTLLAVAEGIAFGSKAGLPMPALHEALTGGAANSWALEVLGRKMLDRDFKPAFAIKHQQKDLGIVLAAARAHGVPLPGTALVHQLLAALEASGRREDGTQSLLTLYEMLSGRS